MATNPDHRTSPIPYFAVLAVFTISVIVAALWVSFGKPH